MVEEALSEGWEGLVGMEGVGSPPRRAGRGQEALSKS